jgi:glycosyltransferase involved in cell wall biosynthesis
MTSKPVVMQMIDSLHIGGAERMSVNIANALAEKGIESYICVTRQSGMLQSDISSNVTLLELDKKSALDIKALLRLRQFVKANGINIIHAHSSSFFTAILCKILCGTKVVWHDHYGNAEKLDQRKATILKLGSYLFDAVISVNEKLKNWAIDNLKVSSQDITYLQNFAKLSPIDLQKPLPSDKTNTIVSLANLRPQKDHMTLLKAFDMIHKRYPNWHLLLVGVDNFDVYSKNIKKYIKDNGLINHVHVLGSRKDSASILRHSTIAVLSSESEGLPVALLEYGLAKLPVVCTDVGQCRDVLGNGKYGRIVPSLNSGAFFEALSELIENKKKSELIALEFYNYVQLTYSQDSVLNKIISIYKGLIDGE